MGNVVIEPIETLTFSMQPKPGLYAVLIGSGVSSAASIPTGWQITLDLVRKLAATRGESADPEPESWFRKHFEEEPDYSTLLGRLARTTAERQLLLRPYFEASEPDREQQLKQPTKAHKAIAALVRQGYIKVIVTTNFDDLMEQALQQVGIAPSVLSTRDAFKGALPLSQIGCCVIKPNGDYRDPSILNTTLELSKYPRELNQLLDRVLDEYGLIVCGWSATWDMALFKAVRRCRSRRFTTFWTTYKDLSGEAQQLIEDRDAVVIPNVSANDFFTDLQERIEALQRVNRPHPLTVVTAVERLKRYLSDHDPVRLRDLILDTIATTLDSMSAPIFEVGEPDKTWQMTPETRTNLVHSYRDICSALLTMGPIGGFYGEESNIDIWQQALSKLTTETPGVSDNHRLGWKGFPATLLLYSLGLGAVAANRWEFLGDILATPIDRRHGSDFLAIRYLHLNHLFYGMSSGSGLNPSQLMGANGQSMFLSQWLHDELRNYTKTLVASEGRYSLLFDKLELLMHFSSIHHSGKPSYGLFWGHRESTQQILQEIEDSISNSLPGDASPFVASGIAGNTGERWNEIVNELKLTLERYS